MRGLLAGAQRAAESQNVDRDALCEAAIAVLDNLPEDEQLAAIADHLSRPFSIGLGGVARVCGCKMPSAGRPPRQPSEDDLIFSTCAITPRQEETPEVPVKDVPKRVRVVPPFLVAHDGTA